MSNQELAVRLVLLAVGRQSADGYVETSQDAAIATLCKLAIADALNFLQVNSIVAASHAKEVGFAYKLNSAFRMESRLIDWVCQVFETAWKDSDTDDRPRIENFIGNATGQTRALLLQELVKIDVEYRQDAGDSPNKEEYDVRFPAETNAVDAAWHDDSAEHADSSSARSLGVVPSVDELSTRLPHLKHLELVGQGGMGVVYRAHDQLGRLIAVKLLPPELNHEEDYVRRFKQEAVLLKNLVHPKIVKIHSFEPQQDLCYFTMEFAEGGNLRKKIIRDVGIPHREAIDITMQVCEGLHFAHELGVIHRDIKPENILLDADGGVKIADFGLARLAYSERRSSFRTGTGQIMGTQEYMAPEQRQGVRDIDRRADVYSIGVLLYELLTGRVPMGAFDLPSTMSDNPKWLDEIILCALRDKRNDRFDGVDEIISSLKERRVIRRQLSSGNTQEFPGAYINHLKDGPNPLALSAFLKSYPKVLATALGGCFLKAAMVDEKGPFDFDPGDLGGFHPDLSVGLMITPGSQFEWRHLVFCAARGRLFIDETPNGDLSWSIQSIRDFDVWRKVLGQLELQFQPSDAPSNGKTFSNRDNHECIILAGRREQLLGEDCECIDLLRSQGILIRSFDWLLDAWNKIRP